MAQSGRQQRRPHHLRSLDQNKEGGFENNTQESNRNSHNVTNAYKDTHRVLAVKAARRHRNILYRKGSKLYTKQGQTMSDNLDAQRYRNSKDGEASASAIPKVSSITCTSNRQSQLLRSKNISLAMTEITPISMTEITPISAALFSRYVVSRVAVHTSEKVGLPKPAQNYSRRLRHNSNRRNTNRPIGHGFIHTNFATHILLAHATERPIAQPPSTTNIARL